METLPKSFGDYLLTSPLGEDCLGRVYRALSLPQGGEFVRLRTLDAPELDPEALRNAVERWSAAPAARAGSHVVRGQRLGLADGVPYLAWNEVHGWTLDVLLAALRRTGQRLPLEHTLLIADGMTTALERGEPHGVLWPGFVSLSPDGGVRLGGFGLTEAILRSVGKQCLAEELAPYLPPEELLERRATGRGDVFSVGVILLELLTDFRSPFPGLGQGVGAAESFPAELGRLLQVALSKPRARFASVGDLRRELGQVIVSGRFRLSSLAFARFLEDLVRPAGLEARPRPSTPRPPRFEDPPPGLPALPALEEAQIEEVLEKVWGRIKA